MKYPDITVTVPPNQNVMHIIEQVAYALEDAQVTQEEIDVFLGEALRGSKEDVLNTAGRWVRVLS